MKNRKKNKTKLQKTNKQRNKKGATGDSAWVGFGFVLVGGDGVGRACWGRPKDIAFRLQE